MKIIKYNTKIKRNNALSLVKESETEYNKGNVSNSTDAYKILQHVFRLSEKSEEYLVMLCLNTKNEVIGAFEISHGSIDSSMLRPADMFKKALLCNARNIIIAHNHPSGNNTPSVQDVEITKRIFYLGKELDIHLLDHLIISRCGFESLRENKMF